MAQPCGDQHVAAVSDTAIALLPGPASGPQSTCRIGSETIGLKGLVGPATCSAVCREHVGSCVCAAAHDGATERRTTAASSASETREARTRRQSWQAVCA